MYYSAWDLQCRCYLHSGRNSQSRFDCASGVLEFLISGDEFEEINNKTDYSKMSKKQLISFVESYEIRIKKHEDKIDDL